jgi:hypothetical protein
MKIERHGRAKILTQAMQHPCKSDIVAIPLATAG